MTVDAAIDSRTEESRLAEALEAARQTEIPEAAACLDVARAHLRLGQADEAARWCGRVIETGLDYRSWDAAARLLDRILGSHTLEPKRTARLAVVGSYTTDQLVDLVRLVAASRGIALDIYEAGYGLYQQEILDPNSGLYRHDPEIVLIAVHDGEVRFPAHSPDPEPVVEAETARWVSLWSQVTERTGARIIQTNFARRPENPFGNLASSLPGARSSMLAALNRRLGEEAAGLAALVDCDHLASVHGRAAWFDDRYRHRSKQEVGLGALPLMALNVVAVLAAELGLSRKCLVLDLDGTVWGGVIGEDGMDRIRVGHGIEGEAFADFQRHVLALKDRGVILAVCSKNDEATAREPFESHPDMLIGLGDIAAFHANWEPKPESLRRIAASLDIGLDSLVFIDDSPGEREAVRRALPEVDVIVLPSDPAGYVAALAGYPWFETASFTAEDAKRTETYRARAEAQELETQSGSLEGFLASLEMRAVVAPFDEAHLPRIVQLIGKTNQFNLTTRRHGQAAVESIMSDTEHVHLYMTLEDRFTNHGLIGLAIGRRDGDVMEIDTLLMSCRVIGRTAENVMVGELARRALEMGCSSLRGIYIPTERNRLVADLYDRLGFEKISQDAEESVWEHRLDGSPIASPHITLETS